MKFQIEQIAIYPPDPKKARQFLEAMGAEFVEDLVVAEGVVYGEKGVTNVGHLQFDYNLGAVSDKPLELEILHYRAGSNWMKDRSPSVSHLAMHCTAIELRNWRQWFASKGISIAQEVTTRSHTNPYLVENGRTYEYCIFDTRSILGVDLKFIVRIDK